MSVASSLVGSHNTLFKALYRKRHFFEKHDMPLFASHTILRLISSTLLHFGKANELALHSASATPGIVSEFSLLSLL
jgi:hypothetical protein